MSKIIKFPIVKNKREVEDAHLKDPSGLPGTWVMLYKTPFEYEAHFVCGLLDTHGIPHFLEPLKHLLHPVSSDQLGVYFIWVPEDWLEIAKSVLKNAQN